MIISSIISRGQRLEIYKLREIVNNFDQKI